MALSKIGVRSKIESLTEANAEAREINLWFLTTREQTLEAFDWSFARKRLTLAAHADDPPEDVWGYRYQYPADCIIIRKLQNPTIPDDEADAIPYQIEVDDAKETLSILTNLEDAVAIYTFNLSTTDLYSKLFIEVFATFLSSRIAFTLTGDKDIANTQFEQGFIMLAQASAINANQQVDKPPREAEWIRGR